MKRRKRLKITPRHIAALSLAGIIVYNKFARCYFWYAEPDVIATESMMLLAYQMWIKDPQAIKQHKYYSGKQFFRKVFIEHKKMFELAHKREESQHISNTIVECATDRETYMARKVERNRQRIAAIKAGQSAFQSRI